MRAVNLLPEESATRLPKTAVLPLAGAAAAVLAAGVVGTLAHSESGNVARESKQLDDLKLQLSKTHAAKQTTGTTSALLASRGSRVAAVEAALSGRVSWDLVLRQIALVLPEDTWLDGLQLTSPTSPDAAATASTSTTTSSTTSTSATTSATAPTGVVINGYTKSADGLARVIQRLSVVPSLSDVTLTTAQATQRGSKRVFQFTINANIATKGAAS